ncbi:MAG: TRAP transporter substrate-binding protein DctP, partial [Bradyrhizobium sp.]
QTYSALQQGVVDGMQSNIAPVWAGKFYEVIKHDVRVNYTASFEEVFIGAKKFASLSPKHQQIILDAAKETEAWIRKYSSDELQTYLDDLKVKGVDIYTPTPAEYAQWISIREKVWEDVAKAQGGKLNLEMAKRIYASQK